MSKNPSTRSAATRERQYYARMRGVGFEKKVESAPDHRDAEEGFTTEGLPAWHGDGTFLSRKEWQESGHGLRARRRLRRPRTAERVITASSDGAIRRFAQHQDAIRADLDEDRGTERSVLARIWRYVRDH